MVTTTAPSTLRQDGTSVPRRRLRPQRRIVDLLTGLWTAVRDGGQLGPDPEVAIGRHAGARI